MTNDENEPAVWWQTVDFKPAPPGWRVVSLFGNQRVVTPVAGWLIQEHYKIRRDGEERIGDRAYIDTPDITGRPRRVVPGVCAEGFEWSVDALDENVPPDLNTWMVLGPGEPEPSQEQQQAEIRRRAEKRDLK